MYSEEIFQDFLLMIAHIHKTFFEEVSNYFKVCYNFEKVNKTLGGWATFNKSIHFLMSIAKSAWKSFGDV